MSDTPTSIDVARLAGVAQSTVSYVFTGKGRISADTRERVLRAAATLNYQPNAGAQALRNRRSRVIGLMFPIHPGGNHPARMRFLTAVVGACREQGYDALVVTADEGPRGLRRLAGTALCDGLLVMEVKQDEPLAAITGALRVPTVFVGVPANHDAVVCVARDYGRAGGMSVERLAEAGHRQVALLSPTSEYFSSLNYYRRFIGGVDSAAREAGIMLTVHGVGPAFIDLHDTVGEVLRAQDPGGAILGGPTVDTADLVSTLLLHGVTPGRDVSIVGISDDAAQAPPLRGVRVAQTDLSGARLARRSVARLMELIDRSPDALRPGEVDLIAPTWTPGDTVLAAAS